jgi:hypothetical protein
METDATDKKIGTEYFVEAVVRKKLLFKARPKPIIVVKKWNKCFHIFLYEEFI